MENIQLEILDKLKSKELKNYLSKLDINNALVFGSIITDNFNEESDVDIAILGTSKLTIKEILKLDRKSTRLNSSHKHRSRMPSSA